ncbi:MAG: phenylalanine--tRNA ligase subunit beta, partial [Verrucomicrobia bacterium]|nr:phenylalanine--tRNA ligase subunit beta [Verrucomicrobiota bacterium]
WLKDRLEACGLRSVNLVVDATNLAMLELGQPLHAFDYAKIEGKQIIVREALNGEFLVTLDGETRVLCPKTLLICDTKKPIAIAGVMGSLDSQVEENTQTVLLEAAYFTPSWVRRAAKHCGLSSEASHRFERGVDPCALHQALDYAAAVICAESKAKVVPGILDALALSLEAKTISLRMPQVERILGVKIAEGEIITFLKRIDLHIVSAKEDVCTVVIPHYRHDLKEEIDLIEEIARFYGYDNLRSKDRAYFRTGLLEDSSIFLFEKKVRDCLLKQGLQELLTCDLISQTEAKLSEFPGRSLIHLLNPKSLDQSILRPSLLPGHLTVVKHNQDHQRHQLAGFEVGRIHFKWKDNFYEHAVAGLVMVGTRDPHQWQNPKGISVDFFALKGVIEALFLRLRLGTAHFRPSSHAAFHPGRQTAILLGQQEVGVLGEVHPQCLQSCEIAQPVYYAELNLDELLHFQQPLARMKPLAQFPGSVRDWTVVIDQKIAVQTLIDAVNRGGFSLLEDVSLLDLYRGEHVASNCKSITLRFVYRDHEKTVAQQAVEAEHARVTQAIMETLNGKMKR